LGFTKLFCAGFYLLFVTLCIENIVKDYLQAGACVTLFLSVLARFEQQSFCYFMQGHMFIIIFLTIALPIILTYFDVFCLIIMVLRQTRKQHFAISLKKSTCSSKYRIFLQINKLSCLEPLRTVEVDKIFVRRYLLIV